VIIMMMSPGLRVIATCAREGTYTITRAREEEGEIGTRVAGSEEGGRARAVCAVRVACAHRRTCMLICRRAF